MDEEYSNLVDIAAEAQKAQQNQSAGFAIDENIVAITAIFILVQAIICGIIATFIAHENERSKSLAFVTGFFLGPLGIAIYAIIGETIELRIAIEEKERRKLQKEYKQPAKVDV